jgi:hypothetical protein
MEVISQLHVPAALLSRNETPVPTEQVIGLGITAQTPSFKNQSNQTARLNDSFSRMLAYLLTYSLHGARHYLKS